MFQNTKNYKEIYQSWSAILFDKESVKVDVYCPVHENVTVGLQKVIKTSERNTN